MIMDVGLRRDQARELDRLAMEEYGVRGLILMENAGRRCASVAEEMLEPVDSPCVSVFCGGGNNGGDGFVIARHLWNHGLPVRIYVVGEVRRLMEKNTDAAVNLEIACNMDLPLMEISSDAMARNVAEEASESNLIVDALLGTGITGEVRGHFRPLIEALNDRDVPILAVDMPSGLDCDTGEVMGAAIRADATVTFVAKKRGQMQPRARQYTGELHVAEISVPRQLIQTKMEQWSGEGE